MAYKPEIRYVQFYTNGSAAQELAPRKPLEGMFFPAKKRKKRVVKVDPLALAGIVVSAVMLVLMIVGLVHLQQARSQVEVMANYVQTLEAENVRLHTQYEEERDLEYIEQLALTFGMIPVEEVQHMTIHVEVPVQQEPPTKWEKILTYLSGLIA